MLMCFAVSIKYDQIIVNQIEEYFSQFQITKFKENSEIIFTFADQRPFLPVIKDSKITLYDWGNRGNLLKGLPPTGWARYESLTQGKWDWLKPKVVLIPALRACEKKVWFAPEHMIKGVLVNYQSVVRIYMITQSATDEYQALTKHHRMPRYHLVNPAK